MKSWLRVKTGTLHTEKGCHFLLAPGTQVRQEDFGLLFYTMNGPRLYFFRCGELLDPQFFRGEEGFSQWADRRALSSGERLGLLRSLDRLREKGIILEC